MKIPSSLELTQAMQPTEPWAKAFVRMLNRLWVFTANAINQHISFGDGNHSQADNIDGVWASVTTPNPANTDFTVVHNLGRIASGVIRMQSKGAACDVYTSPSDPGTSTTQIILRATGVSVPVVLFVL